MSPRQAKTADQNVQKVSGRRNPTDPIVQKASGRRNSADQIVQETGGRRKFRKKRVLLMIETSTSYGRDVLTGISRYAHERNEWSFTLFSRGMTEIPDYIRNWHGDGVIARSPDEEGYKMVQGFHCPVVEMMFCDKEEVCADERGLANLAIDHFVEHCYENIGFFSFGGKFWILERERIFKEVAIARGFAPHIFVDRLARKEEALEPFWTEKYRRSLTAWLHKIPKPIAILALNDIQAVHLIDLCNDLGYQIPNQVAVLGINNDTHLCEILTPTLSSIDQNPQKIGYEVARLLDLKMKGKVHSFYEKLIPPLRVVQRRSTDFFAITNPDVVHALHFIREFATTGIGVNDVLEEVNLTHRTLERYFREAIGHSPSREILLTKIKHATWLLTSSNLSNHQISELSGFFNVKYFGKMFKKEKGITPQQFRQNHQELDDPLK